MKLSARNQIRGTVKAVTLGQVTAEVVVDIGGGNEIVAVITVPSARNLGLAAGKKVVAVVKSTDVMVGLED